MAGYKQIIDAAQQIQAQTGIPTSIIVGQAILESGADLGSGLAQRGKNLFGIKGSGSAGSVSFHTQEYIDGEMKTVTSSFAAYDSWDDSIEDYARLISTDRYAKHLQNADSVEDYARGIYAGGYATDPNYVDKLLGIVAEYNLHQYDLGDYSFDPLAASSSSGGADEQGADGWLENFIFYANRFVIIGGLFVLMVIFIIKAFPAIQKTAGSLTKKAIGAAIPGPNLGKMAKKAGKAADKAVEAAKE